MRDSHGRQIDYLRVSLTDACNLHCRYCMPPQAAANPSSGTLSAPEILAVCQAAADVGIHNFKVTGGEPLLRADAPTIIQALKALPGVRSVTLTTNAQLLAERLPHLAAGLDSINISLDAVSEPLYEQICGRSGAGRALAAVRASVSAGIPTKINTVLLEENADDWLAILSIAEELPVAVRFIERMPVGATDAGAPVVPASVILGRVQRRYPDLHLAPHIRGNGPADYYVSRQLRGMMGIIAANSRPFCAGCNRLRLTSTGQLRPCLGEPDEIDLRSALRAGATRSDLGDLIRQAAAAKPAGHHFEDGTNPARSMYEIGG